MALTISTPQPQALLDAIKRAIDGRKVLTWGYKDVEGVRYFTHTADQWKNLAWFFATIQPGGIVFNIVPSKGRGISTEVYAVYHGRFAEMLLAHFDEMFGEVMLTAMPASGDKVQAA